VTVADPLSDMLALLKPRAYGFRGLDVGGAWSLRLPAQTEVIRCYAVHAGACGLWVDGEAEPIDLQAGDFVLLPHGQALVMGSALDAPAIDLDAFFETADGDTAVVQGGGACSGLGGYFELGGRMAGPLLAALPAVVRLEAGVDGAALRWLVGRLMRELRDPRPGGRLVAEHLSQTLLVEALRQHLASLSRPAGGWLAILADPQLARVLQAIHGDPGRRWTLGELAGIAGMSRSVFAARFTAAGGEPAISYLGRWRMLLAADRLGQGASIGVVARELGYGSESAFGAAFRRITGVPPGHSRARVSRSEAAGRPVVSRPLPRRTGTRATANAE
jgi:AraC-like DNA-binding protein